MTFDLVEKQPKFSENYFALAINADHELRLWHSCEGDIFKARPTTRPLKWVEVADFYTSKKLTWWIYVDKTGESVKDPINEDLSEDLSATTIY